MINEITLTFDEELKIFPYIGNLLLQRLQILQQVKTITIDLFNLTTI